MAVPAFSCQVILTNPAPVTLDVKKYIYLCHLIRSLVLWQSAAPSATKIQLPLLCDSEQTRGCRAAAQLGEHPGGAAPSSVFTCRAAGTFPRVASC